MHRSLERELARIGRTWGALNGAWLASERDYSHGSPAFKWSGAPPCGAESAKPKGAWRAPLQPAYTPMKAKP
jgi:hypothetical protein